MTQPETAVDRLVANASARKGLTLVADKSAGKVPVSLTPVGTEKRGIPDVQGAFLANEGVADVATDLRKQAAYLISVAEALEAHTGLGHRGAEPDLALEVKLMEKEADRQAADREKAAAGDKRAEKRVEQTSDADFQERFARLSDEAKAATFKGDLVPAAKEVFGDDLLPVSGSPTSDWVCPTHGDADIKVVTTRKGRIMRTCATCKQFEKGA